MWTRRGLQRFIILFFIDLATRKVEIAGIAPVADGVEPNRPESHRCGAGDTDWETLPDSRPRPAVHGGVPEYDCRCRSGVGAATTAEPEFEGLYFTLHLISTIRNEWRQPLTVTELPLQALHLSRWIFTRMFV